MIELLLISCCIISAWSMLLIVWNNFLYKKPSHITQAPVNKLSILIPARDEQLNIANAIKSILDNKHVDFELIILNDNSTDDTENIVKHYLQQDSRIIMHQASPLPEGWIGKEHACHLLSQYARNPLLLFVDADVTLAPDALSSLVNELESNDLDFLSGFPRQITKSFSERLIIPMIEFILLGYLPFIGLQKTQSPAFTAACGQLILVKAESYRSVGGHQANADKMHDGLALARNFRTENYRVALNDLVDVATCRMYHDFEEVWHGFSKNATEGMATKTALPIWTLILALGHVIAYLVLPWLWFVDSALTSLAMVAVMISLIQRSLLLIRFNQPLYLLLLHPFAVVVLLAIQWSALFNALNNKPSQWRGRQYQTKL